MGSCVPWTVWLISGVAFGLASGFSSSGVVGLLVAAAILLGPVYIFMNESTPLLSLGLFYGGLLSVSFVIHAWKTAKRNERLRQENEERKRRHGS